MADISRNPESSIEKGELLDDLRILDLTVEGKAVARHHGRVVFLESGLPGARVQARVTEVKTKIILAETVQLLESSSYEAAPWCPHFEECGGCNWQHFSVEAALDWKRRHVHETLTRIGKLDKDIPVLPVTQSPFLRAFRNKMSFVFGEHEGCPNLGLRKWKSHELATIDDCGVIHPQTAEILRYMREAVVRLGLNAWRLTARTKDQEKQKISGYLRYLNVRTSSGSAGQKPQFLLECITGTGHESPVSNNGKISNKNAVKILANELIEHFALSGFVHSERKSLAALAQGEKLVEVYGENSLTEQVGHIPLTIPYNTFFQTNTGAASLLYEHIAREAALTGKETVWDLYCGVGGIGLFLAREAKAVHGFEISEAAVRAARLNARVLHADHCSFHAGDVTSSICLRQPAPDVIIVDPPRSGLSSLAVELLLKAPTAQKLLYVSCNASTQARDSFLLSNQWHPVKSIPVDMFPYTPHIENLLVLNRSCG
jgi:SAM-dependent methyltransferases related to tRNA (uracil-5-)-methyltransferase